MISADEARKVTAEAQEAKKKKMSLEEARKLAKLFESRMKDADQSVKGAMKRGDESVTLRWDHDDFPQGLRERFETAITDAGYGIQVHPGDDGDGWEITVSWSK